MAKLLDTPLRLIKSVLVFKTLCCSHDMFCATTILVMKIESAELIEILSYAVLNDYNLKHRLFEPCFIAEFWQMEKCSSQPNLARDNFARTTEYSKQNVTTFSRTLRSNFIVKHITHTSVLLII